jgi:hypothetical protein
VYCIGAQRERNILQRQNLQVSKERERERPFPPGIERKL